MAKLAIDSVRQAQRELAHTEDSLSIEDIAFAYICLTRAIVYLKTAKEQIKDEHRASEAQGGKSSISTGEVESELFNRIEAQEGEVVYPDQPTGEAVITEATPAGGQA